MSALDIYRQEIRAQLDANCFLRRDLAARALFVCDYPRFSPAPSRVQSALTSLGYIIEEARGVWRIDLAPAKRVSILLPDCPSPLPLPLQSLCHSLRAQGAIPLSRQPWPLLRRTLLYLDSGDTARLYQDLSAAVAICKRTHAPLPVAAAALIEHYAKEDSPC